MTFYEEYTRHEKYFGVHTLRFVVSDTFEDLFKETWDAGDGLEVDIFQTGNISLKLEDQDNTQGVDELSIDIYQSDCRTNTELNAFFFFLEARDITKSRFCTVLFDPVFSGGVALDSCVWFIGKVSEKMQAQDLKWNRTADYAKVITPQRVWKCKAYSFDISIFDRIKMWCKDNTDLITKPDGSTTLPLIHTVTKPYVQDGRITGVDLKEIFSPRLTYGTDYVNANKYIYEAPLANLYDILQLLFDKTEDIILDITGSALTLTLEESSIGLQTSYIEYTLLQTNSGNYLNEVESTNINDNHKILLKLSPTGSGIDVETGLEYSSIYITRRLVNPYWYRHVDGTTGLFPTDETVDDINEVDKDMAFINYGTLTTLLHEIARSLNCYLVCRTTVAGGISIKFMSKDSISEADKVYLKDANNPTISFSSILSTKPTEVFSLSTMFTVDGEDVLRNTGYSTKLMESDKKKAAKIDRDRKKEVNNIESKRLLFSTAWTMRYINQGSILGILVPMNAVTASDEFITGVDEDWYPQTETEFGEVKQTWSGMCERLTSALYIKTTPKEAYQISKLGADTPVWRPATKIFSNLAGENIEKNTLAEFINYTTEHAVQYYENTYEMTVPWWSGFSKSEDGSDPLWSNLVIGSKIPLNEVIRIFDGSSWLPYLHSEDAVFIVMEITRSTEKPETKIKLQGDSKNAYGVWSGSVNSLTALSYSYDTYRNIEFLVDGISVKKYDIAAGNTITEGESVMVQSDGTVIKTIAHSSYRGLVKGIALETGDGDDEDTKNIAVQLKGRVYVEDWDFTGYIGKQLFVRTAISGTNISYSLLYEPTETEDMIIYLGKIDGEHSFIMDIHEYKLEETLCQA